jgi:hypothetical protein
VNGSLFTDRSSSLITGEQGIQLLAPAALHGGFANSGILYISVSSFGSLFVGGLLDLKAKSVVVLSGIGVNQTSPIIVNGSVVLDGSINITLAPWSYTGRDYKNAADFCKEHIWQFYFC